MSDPRQCQRCGSLIDPPIEGTQLYLCPSCAMILWANHIVGAIVLVRRAAACAHSAELREMSIECAELLDLVRSRVDSAERSAMDK